ncbi:class I SAM-dependent methyltransferase [Allocoleopsis franciscana]|uniref:Methyltransferase family protein n=1 Tax=Allocoleopsis franciscana PCC 7113 TaxID=1173027 RepID=K9WBH6_9CYAN|nr:class I SAM-dependent methyltransferase [Allocoleopsis franciscana]AFZ17161.1 methyltransferase family protein [Allocoleopsis franciscana PCC 7113]
MPDYINYPTKNNVFERDWTAYYSAVVGRPPRDTLLTALAHFEAEESAASSRLAVDLGCGEGRDTVELLRRGWRVLGIDGEPEAIARLLNRPDINQNHLQTQIIRFEEMILPEAVDLINASFSLPFCPPEYFPNLWKKIVLSLRSGGRFCGQLFGDRDSWAIYTSMNHHTRQQLDLLLQPFEVEMLEEEDHPGKTALGEDKHWHLFQIVARKR